MTEAVYSPDSETSSGGEIMRKQTPSNQELSLDIRWWNLTELIRHKPRISNSIKLETAQTKIFLNMIYKELLKLPLPKSDMNVPDWHLTIGTR